MIRVGNDQGAIAHYQLTSVALWVQLRSRLEDCPLWFLHLKKYLELASYTKMQHSNWVVLREYMCCQETRWLT